MSLSGNRHLRGRALLHERVVSGAIMTDMKTVVVYKDSSEHARAVIEFLHDFKRQTGKDLETIDPETPSGSAYCEAHDIVEYPTIVATDDAGRHLQTWRGLPLPRIGEVSYYVS